MNTFKKSVQTANVEAFTAKVEATAHEALKPIADAHEQLRQGTEKGVEQIRAHYSTLKDNAEQATDNLEISLAAAQSGTRAFNSKILDLFRKQTNAGFEHLQALFSAQSIEDAMKLQHAFAKNQLEHVQAHAREFADLAKEVAGNVAEPVKASIVAQFKR